MLRDHVAPVLRTLGLKGSGHRYVVPSRTHWALISFVRDRYSTAAHLRFTAGANVVARDEWATAHLRFPWIGSAPRTVVAGYALPKSELPTFWYREMRELMGKDEFWWSVRSHTQAEPLARIVVDSIATYLLPAMRLRIADFAGH